MEEENQQKPAEMELPKSFQLILHELEENAAEFLMWFVLPSMILLIVSNHYYGVVGNPVAMMALCGTVPAFLIAVVSESLHKFLGFDRFAAVGMALLAAIAWFAVMYVAIM